MAWWSTVSRCTRCPCRTPSRCNWVLRDLQYGSRFKTDLPYRMQRRRCALHLHPLLHPHPYLRARRRPHPRKRLPLKPGFNQTPHLPEHPQRRICATAKSTTSMTAGPIDPLATERCQIRNAYRVILAKQSARMRSVNCVADAVGAGHRIVGGLPMLSCCQRAQRTGARAFYTMQSLDIAHCELENALPSPTTRRHSPSCVATKRVARIWSSSTTASCRRSRPTIQR